ncbi:MAG TPA: hypothetical protein VE824_06800 [Gaiellales bacterium]|nr:hypothetical protein [Gaiellales bacterium]
MLNRLKTAPRALEQRLARVGLRMIRPWERLPVAAQVAIAFPTWAVLLFLFHLGPLHQPPVRAAFYGVFWSLVFTPVGVLATQNELRKRRERERTSAGDAAAQDRAQSHSAS